MEPKYTFLEQQALDQMDLHQQELYDLLSKLIQFDSQNFGGEGREEPCARFVEDLYKKAGLETELYYPDFVPGVTEHPLFWPGHQTDKRPNVTGIRWGSDRDDKVMIAAHTDTMPAGDLSLWEDSPWAGVQKDGKIIGLGSCDNKFGIAGAYWALKILDDLGVKLKKTVVLTAYCDEEFGGGNGALAAAVKYPCQAQINLDGGNYEMWATALGGGVYQLKLHMNHTSDDCMAIYRVLNAFMQELDQFGERRRQEMFANTFYGGTPMAGSAFRIASVGCNGETHTDAEVTFVIYTSHTREEIDAELQAIVDKLQGTMDAADVITDGFVHTSRFFHYGEANQEHPAFRLMHQCAEETIGRPVDIKGSCLTDLSVFIGANPTACSYNFGILRDFSLPGGAHQPNEFVDCKEFLAHTKAMILFLLRYCGVENA